MPLVVTSNAQLMCTFGAAPMPVQVVPSAMVNAGKLPAATVMDHQAMVNITPFGMCTAPTNPQVQAAMGSPVPCIPMVQAPWTPGATTVKIGGKAALTDASMAMCQWAGQISVSVPAQQTVNAT